MRIGIATDHGGFDLKEELVAQLRAAGHEIVDIGANSLSPDDDYPDFVTPLGRAVASGQVERGVAICGSGASRPSSPPATVSSNDICAGWARWHRWRRRGVGGFEKLLATRFMLGSAARGARPERVSAEPASTIG